VSRRYGAGGGTVAGAPAQGVSERNANDPPVLRRVRTSSAAGRATSIMAASPGRKVRSRLAAAASIRPTRQRLIAERITASRSAEGGPPPSSRTPPHSICVDVHEGAIVMQPSPPVPACSRLFPAVADKRSVRRLETGHRIGQNESPAGQADDAERIHSRARTAHCGVPACGGQAGTARERPSCSLTMTGHTALHRDRPHGVTPRPAIRRYTAPGRGALNPGFGPARGDPVA